VNEISPGIFMVTEKGTIGAIMPPINLYVITGYDGIIFDAGYGNRYSVNYFLKEMKVIEAYCQSHSKECNITRILPSHVHPDHFSGLKKLRKSLGLSIVLTQQMAKYISSKKSYRKVLERDKSEHRYFSNSNFEWYISRVLNQFFRLFSRYFYNTDFIPDPDIVVKDRSFIKINGEKWEIFLSPGHSDDHISLYDPKRGILFSGDNVLRTINTWLGPPCSNLKEYIKSIEYMLSLPKLELILGAHGSPITNPRERLKEIINWRNMRTKELYEIIKNHGEKGVNINKIIRTMYKGESWMKQRLAKGWVMITLRHLEETNKIMKKDHDGRGKSIVFISV